MVPILNVTLEDQFLWRDFRGHWHALTHKDGGDGVSGHLWSDDGAVWSISPDAPYNNTIAIVGGEVEQCGKRARPMLLVEAGRPRFLSTGATYSRSTGDHTFTTMQPINSDGVPASFGDDQRGR